MKTTKVNKIVSLLLIGVMSLALAACGKDVTGHYTTSIELNSEAFEQMTGGMKLEEGEVLEFPATLDLNEDKTYCLYMDMETAFTNIKDIMIRNSESFCRQALLDQGLAEEEFDTALQTAGYDDFAAFVKETEDSFAQEVDAQISSLNKDDYKTEGTYTVKGDSIVTDEGTDQAGIITINKDGSLTCTLPSDMGITGLNTELTFTK